MRLLRVLIAALIACIAISIPIAYATTSRETARSVSVKRGPGLTLGVSGGADERLASGSKSTQSKWVPRAQAIGVQIVRLDVSWANVAPSRRPTGFNASDAAGKGYRWTALDSQVRELTAAHLKILISIWDAPKWAEGKNIPSGAAAGTWKPNDADFQKFAHAIATRYDGKFADPLNADERLPKVTDWQGWNEPNMAQYLAPQWSNDQKGAKQCKSSDSYSWTGSKALSPGLYRGLANSFYAGIKSVSSSDYVVLAGTAPYGNPNCVAIGSFTDYRVPPVEFDRALFCLNGSDHRKTGCDSDVRFDALDNHPYSPPYTGAQDGPNWTADYTNDVAIPNVGRLTSLLSAGLRAGTVLPKAHKGVWATETAWDTSPKDPYGVPEPKEARWEEEAFYNLWKQGVHTVLWWTLADSGTFNLSTSPWPGQSGEYTSSGNRKPSATAFRFPFITHRTSKSKVGVWGRAPASGTMKIEREVGSGWKIAAEFHVGAREVFQLSLADRGAATFRALDGSHTSLTWSQAA